MQSKCLLRISTPLGKNAPRIYFFATFWWLAFAGCDDRADNDGDSSNPSTSTGQASDSSGDHNSGTTHTLASSTADTTAGACTVRTAPSGKVPGSNELQPGGQRIRLARSLDGENFERLNLTILDQAATPTMLAMPDGQLYVYYTAYQAYKGRDGAALSIGSADGATWQHCELNYQGLPEMVNPVDPDIIALDDGTYRMFVTGPTSSGQFGIHSLDSSDGLNWAYRGEAYASASGNLDSATMRIGSSWHMFVLQLMTVEMTHSTSPDAVQFTAIDTKLYTIDGQPHVLSQGLVDGEATRIFGFSPMGQKIRSFRTTDGSDLVADETVHLSFDAAQAEESIFIKDPAVAFAADRSIWMVYSTAIPD
jgi:hypothetical protein